MRFYGYPEWTSVYNSACWVVDDVDTLPAHGGAVVLVDEDLNVAQWRIHSDPPTLSSCPFTNTPPWVVDHWQLAPIDGNGWSRHLDSPRPLGRKHSLS
jgi:hypothetical protein